MNALERFLGGSIFGVLVRLIALSVAVGVVLAWLDLTPWALVDSLRRFVERACSPMASTRCATSPAISCSAP